MPVSFEGENPLRPLKQSFAAFPAVDEKFRTRVKAEVVFRVLNFVLPPKSGPLTFEHLIGKRR